MTKPQLLFLFIFGISGLLFSQVPGIDKKEFYFIRHGQTDYNAGLIPDDQECPLDIPLNETGRQQAYAAEQIVSALPVKTICYSPLTRAQETKDIVTANLNIPEHEISDLTESCLSVWNEMHELESGVCHASSELIKQFMDAVMYGLNHALSYEGPVLVVGHSGFYYALCILLGEGNRHIDNCAVMHFYLDENDAWKIERVKK